MYPVKDNIYFIIPAFNEENAIALVLSSLIESGYNNIIVVDDGSTDNTASLVKKFPVIYIRHIINRGQGAALGTGFEYASSQKSCKYAVTFDADGQHRIEDVETMARTISEKELDIVLGSRFLDLESKSLPFSRKIMLRAAAVFLRFVYGLKITDAHNGLRIIRRECLPLLVPQTDGMLHASEILYLIKKAHLKYTESPVSINYTDYSLSKGQKTSGFLYLGILTLYHKITLLLFERD